MMENARFPQRGASPPPQPERIELSPPRTSLPPGTSTTTRTFFLPSSTVRQDSPPKDPRKTGLLRKVKSTSSVRFRGVSASNQRSAWGDSEGQQLNKGGRNDIMSMMAAMPPSPCQRQLTDEDNLFLALEESRKDHEIMLQQRRPQHLSSPTPKGVLRNKGETNMASILRRYSPTTDNDAELSSPKPSSTNNTSPYLSPHQRASPRSPVEDTTPKIPSRSSVHRSSSMPLSFRKESNATHTRKRWDDGVGTTGSSSLETTRRRGTTASSSNSTSLVVPTSVLPKIPRRKQSREMIGQQQQDQIVYPTATAAARRSSVRSDESGDSNESDVTPLMSGSHRRPVPVSPHLVSDRRHPLQQQHRAMQEETSSTYSSERSDATPRMSGSRPLYSPSPLSQRLPSISQARSSLLEEAAEDEEQYMQVQHSLEQANTKRGMLQRNKSMKEDTTFPRFKLAPSLVMTPPSRSLARFRSSPADVRRSAAAAAAGRATEGLPQPPQRRISPVPVPSKVAVVVPLSAKLTKALAKKSISLARQRRSDWRTYTEPLQCPHSQEREDEEPCRYYHSSRTAYTPLKYDADDEQLALALYPDSVGQSFDALVPRKILKVDFWERYFFRCVEKPIFQALVHKEQQKRRHAHQD